VVTLDTLNRSLVGSENKDEDMGAYIAAADRFREEFNCAVIIVHHCGHEATRPRGHTSLGGACDAQLAVKRSGNTSTLTVEWMKDGEEGVSLCSHLEVVEIAPLVTSCVLVPAAEEAVEASKQEQKMTANQKTMYRLLYAAGRLKTDEWNERARDAGIGVKRRADLVDIRMALIDKRMIRMSVTALRYGYVTLRFPWSLRCYVTLRGSLEPVTRNADPEHWPNIKCALARANRLTTIAGYSRPGPEST
jgi:hypothetical protein